MSRPARQLVLLGATGFTGRLIAAALTEGQLSFVPAGRSAERLAELFRGEPLIVDATEPAAFVERLEPGAIVINCAGPFSLYGTALTEALARRGELTCLDVSGEQQFVEDSLSRNDEAARASGTTLIHACAFESFLADLMAERLVEGAPSGGLDDLSSFYWFERVLSSPGTRLTMKLAPHLRTVILRGGALVARSPGLADDAPPLPGVTGRDRAVFAPYPEVLFFARRLRPRDAGSYMLLTGREAQLFARPAGLTAPPPIEAILDQHRRLPRREPTPALRARQRCGVVVAARQGERSRALHLVARDPYGLTAAIVTWAARFLVDHPGEATPGVRSPAEVFPAGPFFEALESWAPLFESLRLEE